MNPIWIQNRWLLFLKPVFHFWLRILWFDCDFVFTSLYYFFFCSFRGKSNLFIFLVYIQSKVSYHWEFVVTAGVLNLWGTCGTRPLNLSLLLHCCPTVHWGVCFSPGPFSESSSLSLLSSFSALTTGKGLWEILQFFVCSPVQYPCYNGSSALPSSSLGHLGCPLLLFHLQLRVLSYIGFHLVHLCAKSVSTSVRWLYGAVVSQGFQRYYVSWR